MQPPAETNTKPVPSITGREHECEVSRKCAFKEPLKRVMKTLTSSVLKDTTLK